MGCDPFAFRDSRLQFASYLRYGAIRERFSLPTHTSLMSHVESIAEREALGVRAETYENDSITIALDVIGDRWSLLVLRGVFRGLHRFGELRDDLGIATNLLTTRLKRLVDNDILERVQYHSRPTRFEYRLTEAGRDLSPVLVSLMQWGDRHRNDGHEPVVLSHVSCGQPIHNVTQCASCQTEVAPTEITRLVAT